MSGSSSMTVDAILKLAREEAEDVRGRLEEGRTIAGAITALTAELAEARTKLRQEIQAELDAAERKVRKDSAEAQTRAARLVAEAEQRMGEARRTAAAIVAEAEARARAATASERARVEAYLRREDQIEARRQAVQTFARGAGDELITLNVRGVKFQVDLQTLLQAPNAENVLAQTVTLKSPKDGSYYVNGDPTHFHFVLNFLSDGAVPAEASSAELKWLEREAKRYALPELAEHCRRAHNRLDVPRVLELLNGQQKNLSGMDMHALELTGMDFSGASLHHVNLSGAVLRRTMGKEANFRWANLSGVDLEGADVTGADLCDCDLTGGANLKGVVACNAKFEGANLSGVDLEGADVTGADLRDCDLTGGANLKGVVACNAKFEGANLSGADLEGADLTGADLRECNLTNANLSGSKLKSGTLLVAKNLTKTFRDGQTPKQRKRGGCTAEDMKAVGYTVEELKAGGYTVEEMHAGGYTARDLKAGGLGYTAAELRAGGYTAEEMMAGGYTAEELMAIGFEPRLLYSTGYCIVIINTLKRKKGSLEFLIYKYYLSQTLFCRNHREARLFLDFPACASPSRRTVLLVTAVRVLACPNDNRSFGLGHGQLPQFGVDLLRCARRAREATPRRRRAVPPRRRGDASVHGVREDAARARGGDRLGQQ
jgi:uncharacterized protein YjbI with pentapeptide repeats